MASDHGEQGEQGDYGGTSEGVVGIFLAIALIVMVFAFMVILVG